MAKIDVTPCPACTETTLEIIEKLVAKPPGTFSLSGYQMKISAYQAPFLVCQTCTWEIEGRYTNDFHVVFDVDTEDPWASATPELKEVPVD